MQDHQDEVILLFRLEFGADLMLVIYAQQTIKYLKLVRWTNECLINLVTPPVVSNVNLIINIMV